MTEPEKKRFLAKIKEAHPIDAKRKYFGRKAVVVGYEQDERTGYVYVICNIEDPYKGGFATKYVTPNCLKK